MNSGKSTEKDMSVIAIRHGKARLTVSSIMLVLALIGVIITCMDRESSFSRWYWTGAVVVFAILSLWMSRIDSPKPRSIKGLAVWRGIVHWLALLIIIFHVHLLVYAGIADNITAGLVILMLLALTTFLAGLYYDSTFMLIGALLFVMGVIATMLYKYVLLVSVIALVVIGLIIFWLYRRSTGDKK